MYRYASLQIFVVLVTILSTGCGQKAMTDQGKGPIPPARDKDSNSTLVRVFNSFPNLELDVFVDEKLAFKKVPSSSVTRYHELPGKQTIALLICRSGQTDRPLAQKTETITLGHRYTVIALPGNRAEDPKIAVLSDNSLPAPGDQVRIRFINASPSLGEADLFSTSRELLFENVQFESEAGYRNFPLPRGLEIRAEDNTCVARISNAHLSGGNTYTIVAVGQFPKVRSITVEDQPIAD